MHCSAHATIRTDTTTHRKREREQGCSRWPSRWRPVLASVANTFAWRQSVGKRASMCGAPARPFTTGCRPSSPLRAPWASGAHVHGVSAIRSLEMAAKPGMRGRDRKVCDNLEAVEVQFLSPRCQDDAHAPRLRLTNNVVKRVRKVVTRNPPAHPAEQSCVRVGTRTHYGIVVMNNKPTWIIGLAQKGVGKGWTY